jgi:hypothetical protein
VNYVILKYVILEPISSQKCRMNMCPILNRCRGMGIWNILPATRRGHVHRQATASVALQLPNSAVRLCNLTCRYIIKLWKCHLHFPVKNTWIWFSMGFIMARRLASLRNFGDHFHDEESQMDVWSVIFTDSWEKVACFWKCLQLLSVQYDRMWIWRKTLL